jgi:hypothetical protein
MNIFQQYTMNITTFKFRKNILSQNKIQEIWKGIGGNGRVAATVY